MVYARFKKLPLAAAVSGAIVGISLGLSGCESASDGASGADGKDGTAYTMSFASIAVATDDAEKRINRAATEVTINGTTHAIGYKALVRTNQELPLLGAAAGQTATFGALIDKNGAVMLDAENNPKVCTNGSGPDHTSLLT